jgi:hypothetical protein
MKIYKIKRRHLLSSFIGEHVVQSRKGKLRQYRKFMRGAGSLYSTKHWQYKFLGEMLPGTDTHVDYTLSVRYRTSESVCMFTYVG